LPTDLFSKQYTITDGAKYLESFDLVLYDCNIHVATYPVYYGNGINQTAQLGVGMVLWFKELNLNKIYFKNVTGGSAGVVSVVGVIKRE